MEFLLISPTKMKVKLTFEEIKKYSLTDMEAERVDSGTRKGLWQLMDIAKEKHGFKLNGEKMLVQFYKTDFGGELFVTKLVKESARTEKMLEGATNITLLKENRSIYRFSDADSVIRALLRCARLLPATAELYYSDDRFYYLMLTVRRDSITDTDFLSEYGEQIPQALASSILEHSRLLGGTDELSLLLDASSVAK